MGGGWVGDSGFAQIVECLLRGCGSREEVSGWRVVRVGGYFGKRKWIRLYFEVRRNFKILVWSSLVNYSFFQLVGMRFLRERQFWLGLVKEDQVELGSRQGLVVSCLMRCRNQVFVKDGQVQFFFGVGCLGFSGLGVQQIQMLLGTVVGIVGSKQQRRVVL